MDADLYFLETIRDRSLVDPILSDDERERADRYLVEHARLEYLTGRLLVRTTLSRYAPVAPENWRFDVNEHGCPTVPGLHFNLSHSGGLAVLIVSKEHEVGVDVEPLSRGGECLEVAESVFSPRELAGLFALEPALRPRRALDLWTLKEAYIKARKKGLALPLDRFSFVGFDPPRVVVDPEIDDGKEWRFELRVVGSFQVACAVQGRA
jgi:4'-phosphopantetheinyl transferase